jgi:hypothetical protein
MAIEPDPVEIKADDFFGEHRADDNGAGQND